MDYKVGDKIYLIHGSSIIRREQITRITRTLIRSENYSYRHPGINSNFLYIKGQSDVWSRLSARLETPELKQAWHEQGLRLWMKNNWQTIPIEYIEELKAKMEKQT